MATKILLALLFSAAAVVSAQDTTTTYNMTINLARSTNSTGGEGNVAAGGQLSPFGDIGVGCGVNFENGVGYGAGLTAGSEDFGLGGGYQITPTTMQISSGIGISIVNASADFDFLGYVNGTFEFTFSASSDIACVPSSQGGRHLISCTTS